MRHRGIERWRWNIKTAIASTIVHSRTGGLVGSLRRGRTRPLILGYHRVVDDFDAAARLGMPSMLTSRAMFEQHLDFVGRHFRFVSVDEIGARVASGVPFTDRVAAVTFDDGYRDVYEQAVPVLIRKGIPAAVFVVTDLVGRPAWQAHDRMYALVNRAFASWSDPRRELTRLLTSLGLPAATLLRPIAIARGPMYTATALLPALSRESVDRVIHGLEASVGNGVRDMPLTLTWPMLAEMQRGGFTIGSHTRRHVSMPTESETTVTDELEGSKRDMERELGATISHFAYPGGEFTPRDVTALARAGYRFGYTACQHGDPRHPALTMPRLLLWERSSVDADGRFSPAILDCQAHDLWPSVRRCTRVHQA